MLTWVICDYRSNIPAAPCDPWYRSHKPSRPRPASWRASGGRQPPASFEGGLGLARAEVAERRTRWRGDANPTGGDVGMALGCARGQTEGTLGVPAATLGGRAAGCRSEVDEDGTERDTEACRLGRGINGLDDEGGGTEGEASGLPAGEDDCHNAQLIILRFTHDVIQRGVGGGRRVALSTGLV